METQGWCLLKSTSSCNTGHRIFSCFVSTSGLLLSAGFGARCWDTLVGCWFSLISSSDALISPEARPQEFGWVYTSWPQYRLREWSLFRVLQNCLHCVGFSWGLTKQRTSLTAAFIFRSAETSVLLLWGFLFPDYFCSIGFCNVCINIFIWLCNCIDPWEFRYFYERKEHLERRLWSFFFN